MHQVSRHEDVSLSQASPSPALLLQICCYLFRLPPSGCSGTFSFLKITITKKKERKQKHVHIPDVLRGTSRRFEWVSAAELCKPSRYLSSATRRPLQVSSVPFYLGVDIWFGAT